MIAEKLETMKGEPLQFCSAKYTYVLGRGPYYWVMTLYAALECIAWVAVPKGRSPIVIGMKFLHKEGCQTAPLGACALRTTWLPLKRPARKISTLIYAPFPRFGHVTQSANAFCVTNNIFFVLIDFSSTLEQELLLWEDLSRGIALFGKCLLA